ncbi:MAG TPA: hypothetical protein VFB16_14585 [Bauldia sp.]|nr:hypothetical protein [Bauldia sp.]
MPVPIVAPTLPRFAVPIDENGFVDWLVDAEPGDRIAYYRGHLGHDRVPSTAVLKRDERANLNAVAHRVLAAAEQGLVLPVQKRIGPEDCLYLAVKAIGGLKRRPARAAALMPVPALQAEAVPALAAA